MGLNTALEAALTGLGIAKSSGANLADSTLNTVAAIPAGATGVDIVVVSGQIFWTNDGSAATANSFLLDTGQVLKVRNSAALLVVIHLFASAAYDIRLAWWK